MKDQDPQGFPTRGGFLVSPGGQADPGVRARAVVPPAAAPQSRVLVEKWGREKNAEVHQPQQSKLWTWCEVPEKPTGPGTHSLNAAGPAPEPLLSLSKEHQWRGEPAAAAASPGAGTGTLGAASGLDCFRKISKPAPLLGLSSTFLSLRSLNPEINPANKQHL